MKQIRTLVIDDERLARKELKGLLAQHEEIKIEGECTNADEAIKMISDLKPDLIFLDIQMPGKSGFEMLHELNETPNVIFVTAYDEYALKAFEVNALDYLLKPVEENRLKETLKKAFDKSQPNEEPEEMLGINDQVFVKDGDKCWFVKLEDIRLLESEGNYVRVYFDRNKPLILRSLNNLDSRLNPKDFFRANRKHIINLNWIEKIDSWFNGGLRVVLRGGETVEISRRQATKLKDQMSL